MHSGTKYFAGHSDTLIGTLSVRTTEEWMQLWSDRTYTGGVPGSLDVWLLLRSLRTLNLRITRQCKTATALAKWLNSLTEANYANSGEEAGNGTKGVIHKVYHTSLQKNASDLIAEDGSKQMTSGPACFGMLLEKEIYAEYLPSRLQLFFVSLIFILSVCTDTGSPADLRSLLQNATSLGGVESLVEQRKISDPGCDARLGEHSTASSSIECRDNLLTFGSSSAVRLSIGLEVLEDLKEDFRQAFRKVAEVRRDTLTRFSHSLVSGVPQ